MNFLINRILKIVSKYKIYLKSSFLYLFSSVFTGVIGIAINPLMAKNLSPDDYAVMGYFSSFGSIFLPISSFSLISYYLRNYFKIPDERKQVVSDTILIALLVWGFVVLVLASLFFYFFVKWSNVSFLFYPYVLLTFGPIYLNNFVTLYQVNCRIKRQAAKYGTITIFGALLSTIFAIVFVVFYKYGASGRLFAAFLASILMSVYCFKELFVKYQFDFSVIKDAIKFGWPLSLSAILWYFLTGVDRAMLEKLNDSYTFGFYNVAIQLTGYFSMFYVAIGNTFEPDIYRAISENKKRKLLKISGVILLLNALPNIIFIIFASPVISLLTYNRYTDSAGFAQILALKNITVSFYYEAITILVGYGFTKSELVIRALGALICIVMFKLLIQNFGFYGAAWGQVFSFVLMSAISLSYLFYLFKKKKLI